jgi:uncharacterized phage protein gp47/JayE
VEVKTYDEIYASMRNYIIAHQDKLTDFNAGSILASQVEATARELALLYIRCRVGFASYLRALPYSVFGFTQKTGLRASVRLTFSRAKPYASDTAIPVGTIAAAGGLRFITTEAGTIAAGETDSSGVESSAEDIGEKYNVAIGTVKTIVSTLPADIVAVSNATPASGGVDAERWVAYMSRFAEYIRGLSRTNGAGFQAALRATNAVRSLSIEEHFPPVDGIWNMTVYLEDGSGGMTDDAIATVKAIIDGNGANTDGGYRAPGVNVRYLTPEKVPIAVVVKATAERDVVNDMDESAITAGVVAAVVKFVNALEIGRDFVLSDLLVVLKRLTYLFDVEITAPAENVVISQSQIARYETCAVSVIIGGDK